MDPIRSSAVAASYPGSMVYSLAECRRRYSQWSCPPTTRSASSPESIESVIAQTVDDWELLVVDDASTDATKQIIASTRSRTDESDYSPDLGTRDQRTLATSHSIRRADSGSHSSTAMISGTPSKRPRNNFRRCIDMEPTFHTPDIDDAAMATSKESLFMFLASRISYHVASESDCMFHCNREEYDLWQPQDASHKTTAGSRLLARLTERRNTNRCRCHRTSCLVPAARRLAFGKQADRRHVLLEAAQRGGKVQYGQIPLAIHWLCSRGREAARPLEEAMMHMNHSPGPSHFPARLARSSAIRSYQWRLRKNSPRALAPSQSRL